MRSQSDEMRRLDAKWRTGTAWPKWLDSVSIEGLRGWSQQRFEFRFPIMAVVGENGAGKSTILQAAASVYQHPADQKLSGFASNHFPDTPWDHIANVTIAFSGRNGDQPFHGSVRKPDKRWRGNPDRPHRYVEYIDLSRIQPVAARFGYSQLLQAQNRESGSRDFAERKLARFSQIMGRTYGLARMAMTEADPNRAVPVLSHRGAVYSGWHGGAGETTVAEFLNSDLRDTALVLIDEIETSLHPRVQRRLVRDLAAVCREKELQILLTTHSPYVLDELPLDARAYILETLDGRKIVYGVSPEFAMSQMDIVPHVECDLYVEDARARDFLTEILVAHDRSLVRRCQVISYGAASVGRALGQMIEGDRSPRPSRVFLDGDQAAAPGCVLLPGGDAPERVVFGDLFRVGWGKLADRVGRQYGEVAAACNTAMTLTQHHDWAMDAASRLTLSSDTLWQAMCAEWATACLPREEARPVVMQITDALEGVKARSAMPVRA